jgi:CheY-like chemotaxis protein
MKTTRDRPVQVLLDLLQALTPVTNRHVKCRALEISGQEWPTSPERHLRIPRQVAPTTSYRKKHHKDLWHFCSNCTNWPVKDFDKHDDGAPPLGEFCPECLENQRQGTCAQSRETRPSASTARKKILIIDDQPDVLRVLTLSLRHLGYETCEASDAGAGIRMSFIENPDLIVMDVSLPDSSGLETAKRIKDNSQTSHIPIVACSGWKSDEILAQAEEAGIVEFLSKPISPELLAAVIEKFT